MHQQQDILKGNTDRDLANDLDGFKYSKSKHTTYTKHSKNKSKQTIVKVNILQYGVLVLYWTIAHLHQALRGLHAVVR